MTKRGPAPRADPHQFPPDGPSEADVESEARSAEAE